MFTNRLLQTTVRANRRMDAFLAIWPPSQGEQIGPVPTPKLSDAEGAKRLTESVRIIKGRRVEWDYPSTNCNDINEQIKLPSYLAPLVSRTN